MNLTMQLCLMPTALIAAGTELWWNFQISLSFIASVPTTVECLVPTLHCATIVFHTPSNSAVYTSFRWHTPPSPIQSHQTTMCQHCMLKTPNTSQYLVHTLHRIPMELWPIYTSSNVSVSYTVISNSSNGMVVWLCNYVNISHSTILYSDIYGMSIAGGDSISVENSIVKYSFYSGVCLDQNTVRNVTVLYATMDIMIMDSVGSCVFDSTVSSSQLSRGVTVFTSNDTHIENVVFLATTSSREPPYMDVHYLFLESIRIGDCYNMTMVAIHLANLQRGITVYSSFYISISESSFMSMKPLTFASDPTSLPSVLLLYYSTLSILNSSFSGNEISGVKLFGSNVTLSGQLSFINNTAPSGTAFILSKDNSLRLSREGHTIFANNRATNTGGVFYIATNMHYVVEYICGQQGHSSGGGYIVLH